MSDKEQNVDLARRFHETYERLALEFGYETRPDTKEFDPESPNGKLMVAVITELAVTRPTPKADVVERAGAFLRSKGLHVENHVPAPDCQACLVEFSAAESERAAEAAVREFIEKSATGMGTWERSAFREMFNREID